MDGCCEPGFPDPNWTVFPCPAEVFSGAAVNATGRGHGPQKLIKLIEL